MIDPLTQLLRDADRQTPAPMVNPIGLPARVRQSAERQVQRRIATRLLATIPILACLLLVVIQHLHQSQPSLVQADLPSDRDLKMQIAYHQRVAELLEANPPIAPQPAVTDAFLQKLQLERSKAALVLLNNAKDRLRDDPTNADAVSDLHQTIALFPDTPAATMARQQIDQLENIKRQS